MVSVKQFQVTFDCAEPERVARFWYEVLGYVVPPPPEGFATWDDYDRSLPPEGKIVKNRVHLDVRAGTGLVGEERLATLQAGCDRLLALGATHVLTQRADEYNESCITLQDIEGNEFCLD